MLDAQNAIQPHEYVYIDAKRLRAYYEQLQPDPTFVKVPEWAAALSLTGPRIEASQKATLRPATTYEQIDVLLRHLKTQGQLAPSFRYKNLARQASDYSTTYIPFVFAALRVVRAVLTLPGVGAESRHVTLWLHWDDSREATFDGNLLSVCLMEDYMQNDAPVNYPSVSAYSAMLGALRECYPELRSVEASSGDALHGLLKAPGTADRVEFVPIADLVAKFNGRVVGGERRVEILARVREFWSSTGYGTHVFGYPIFIREVSTVSE